MPPNNLLLFVYGTLRRGCPTGAHQRYLDQATFIASAKARGQLFLIDYYPGFSLADGDQTVESWVAGEVYLLKNEAQLQQLDHYEGCASDSPLPHEYRRARIEAILASGEIVKPWTYIYSGDPSPLQAIASGDFLRR